MPSDDNEISIESNKIDLYLKVSNTDNNLNVTVYVVNINYGSIGFKKFNELSEMFSTSETELNLSDALNEIINTFNEIQHIC